VADSGRGAVLEALRRGDTAAAEALCDGFLRDGGGAEGMYLMGAIQSLKGDKAAAARLIGRAAELLPRRSDIAYNHGVALREIGRIPDAAAEWKRAIAIDPANRDAAANLALALDQIGDAQGAVDQYRRLVERWPDDRDGLYNFANLCQRAGQFDAAAALYRRLTEKHASFVPGWINFGMLRKRSRDWAGAEDCYRRAIALDPGSAAAHFNLSNLLLQQERWREGWEAYEWRLRLPDQPPPRFPQPGWTGTEPAGTRVLLWGDQGYGDAIQFLRFAAQVAERGHRAIAVVKTELKSLAATIPGVDAAYGPGDDLPEVDAQIALASLPRALGIESRLLWHAPYIAAPGAAPRATTSPRSRVGLVWAGDPRHPNDAQRSASLDALKPLLEIDGIDWHGLQLGPARDQIAMSPWSGRMVDESPRMTDFAATAAIVASLDLVLTVDTSVAHLVGAMGKDGIVMLPFVDCDWRWLTDGERTPWYPTLTLVRQPAAQDWKAVTARVADLLAAKAK
jgi:tetratricopeptide (TPR) repeat protein